MGTLTLTDAYITVDSNDISADSNQVTLNYEADAVEETAFGDDTHIMKGGLKNWSMDVSLNSDYAASALDSILFPLVGTVVTIEVRATSDSVGTSNPEYTASGLITSYTPIQGSVGDLATGTLNIVPAGTLSRVTS